MSDTNSGFKKASIGLGAFAAVATVAAGAAFYSYMSEKKAHQSQQQQNRTARSDSPYFGVPSLSADNPKSGLRDKPPRRRSGKIESDICPICLEDKATSVFSCGHAFHPECIIPYMKMTDKCPKCRAPRWL